jgi:hypothetical protein
MPSPATSDQPLPAHLVRHLGKTRSPPICGDHPPPGDGDSSSTSWPRSGDGALAWRFPTPLGDRATT